LLCAEQPRGFDVPARINKMHSEQVRAKIQASALLTRLHSCAMGDIELTPTQLNAINSLLDRSVPKLSQIQHTGENGGPIQMGVTLEVKGVPANG
jgi:hypothetical protein